MANDEQLDPVEQVFLHAYPNPDRIGCPGDDIVRAIAQKKLPLGHPAREHLARCSPCYADFKRFQREQRKRAAAIRLFTALAGMIILGFLSWVLLRHVTPDSDRGGNQTVEAPPPKLPRPTPPADSTPKIVPETPSVSERGTTVAVLNLEGLSRTRGVNKVPEKPALQRLPRKPRISLSIYLPLGSEEGRYEIRLLRNTNEVEQPVRTYKGVATVQRGLTVLPIAADFSTLEPGTYVLAFRRENESWRFGHVALD